MRPLLVAVTGFIVAAVLLSLGGCAPLRDQNGNPVLDRNGNEQYHKAI